MYVIDEAIATVIVKCETTPNLVRLVGGSSCGGARWMLTRRSAMVQIARWHRDFCALQRCRNAIDYRLGSLAYASWEEPAGVVGSRERRRALTAVNDNHLRSGPRWLVNVDFSNTRRCEN